MKKNISDIRILWALLFTMLTASPWVSAAQPSAQSSVNKMIAAIKEHPSLEIVFTVWNNGNSTSGSMSVAGKKFHLSTPEMKIWYDGKTQWSYAPSAGEVNISEPTADELAQTNPLSVLSSLDKNFTFRRLNSQAGQERIELTPKKKTPDFASAIITINASTFLPKEISIKNARGNVTTVKISSIKGGKTKPIGTFRFNQAEYPGVEIVDLR